MAQAAPLIPAPILPGQCTLARRHGRVILTVRGYMTWQEGRETAEQLSVLVGAERTEFVGNLTEMEGYDRSARHRWQEALAAQRHHITKVWVVGASPMLRVAASAVALYARIPMMIVSSLDDLPSPR